MVVFESGQIRKYAFLKKLKIKSLAAVDEKEMDNLNNKVCNKILEKKETLKYSTILDIILLLHPRIKS